MPSTLTGEAPSLAELLQLRGVLLDRRGRFLGLGALLCLVFRGRLSPGRDVAAVLLTLGGVNSLGDTF